MYQHLTSMPRYDDFVDPQGGIMVRKVGNVVYGVSTLPQDIRGITVLNGSLGLSEPLYTNTTQNVVIHGISMEDVSVFTDLIKGCVGFLIALLVLQTFLSYISIQSFIRPLEKAAAHLKLKRKVDIKLVRTRSDGGAFEAFCVTCLLLRPSFHRPRRREESLLTMLVSVLICSVLVAVVVSGVIRPLLVLCRDWDGCSSSIPPINDVPDPKLIEHGYQYESTGGFWTTILILGGLGDYHECRHKGGCWHASYRKAHRCP